MTVHRNDHVLPVDVGDGQAGRDLLRVGRLQVTTHIDDIVMKQGPVRRAPTLLFCILIIFR